MPSDKSSSFYPPKEQYICTKCKSAKFHSWAEFESHHANHAVTYTLSKFPLVKLQRLVRGNTKSTLAVISLRNAVHINGDQDSAKHVATLLMNAGGNVDTSVSEKSTPAASNKNNCPIKPTPSSSTIVPVGSTISTSDTVQNPNSPKLVVSLPKLSGEVVSLNSSTNSGTSYQIRKEYKNHSKKRDKSKTLNDVSENVSNFSVCDRRADDVDLPTGVLSPMGASQQKEVNKSCRCNQNCDCTIKKLMDNQDSIKDPIQNSSDVNLKKEDSSTDKGQLRLVPYTVLMSPSVERLSPIFEQSSTKTGDPSNQQLATFPPVPVITNPIITNASDCRRNPFSSKQSDMLSNTNPYNAVPLGIKKLDSSQVNSVNLRQAMVTIPGQNLTDYIPKNQCAQPTQQLAKIPVTSRSTSSVALLQTAPVVMAPNNSHTVTSSHESGIIPPPDKQPLNSQNSIIHVNLQPQVTSSNTIRPNSGTNVQRVQRFPAQNMNNGTYQPSNVRHSHSTNTQTSLTQALQFRMPFYEPRGIRNPNPIVDRPTERIVPTNNHWTSNQHSLEMVNPFSCGPQVSRMQGQKRPAWPDTLINNSVKVARKQTPVSSKQPSSNGEKDCEILVFQRRSSDPTVVQGGNCTGNSNASTSYQTFLPSSIAKQSSTSIPQDAGTPMRPDYNPNDRRLHATSDFNAVNSSTQSPVASLFSNPHITVLPATPSKSTIGNQVVPAQDGENSLIKEATNMPIASSQIPSDPQLRKQAGMFTMKHVGRSVRPDTIDLTTETESNSLVSRNHNAIVSNSSSLEMQGSPSQPTHVKQFLTCQVCNQVFNCQMALKAHLDGHLQESLCGNPIHDQPPKPVRNAQVRSRFPTYLPFTDLGQGNNSQGRELYIPVIDASEEGVVNAMEELGMNHFIPISHLMPGMGDSYAIPLVTASMVKRNQSASKSSFPPLAGVINLGVPKTFRGT